MTLAFFLDNRGFAQLGTLPDPLLGNPGIGGADYEVLAVVSLLSKYTDSSASRPILFLTVPQEIRGLSNTGSFVVSSLSESIILSLHLGVSALVFRPGFVEENEWGVLRSTSLPLIAWFHNLGCYQQDRYEALPAIRRWVLLSGAQLDYFQHSRLSQKAVVIPYPVFVPPSYGGSRSLDHVEKTHDIAYVGALTPFKSFHRLASNWSSIARACPNATLRVFGGADLYGTRASADQFTPYELYCRDLLTKSGFQHRVVFEGSCGLERYEKFNSVRVGVVNPTGTDETFCLSAAEFSACGIPVVAPRRNVLIQTVLDNHTGLLFSSDSEFTSHCIQLLLDTHRSFELGNGGVRHVSLVYSPSSIVDSWNSLALEVAHATPVTVPYRPTTPWWHELRLLRQLWGALLFFPFWPSWPTVKFQIKRFVQGGPSPLGSRGIGVFAGFIAFLLWASLVFIKFAGNPTGLSRIGDALPLSPLLAQEKLLIFVDKRGNDGQQFLALATDPFQIHPLSSLGVDNPIYRGKRLLYPLLAFIAGLGHPRLITWTLGLINVTCISASAWLVAQWALMEQRNPRWGLAVLALPGYWVTLTLTTADLLATTLLLSAAVAWRRGRLGTFAGALSAALLTRETALLAWVSTGLTALWERRWFFLLPFAFVPVPLLALTAWLKARFAATTDALLATLHFGPPGLGILQKIEQLLGLRMLPGPPLLGLERAFDGLCLLFWLATLGVLLATALLGWGGRWLRITAAMYLLPALCTSIQILGRFPDYTRVWIDLSSLALLALLSSRSRLLSWWLGGAAVLSLGYGFGFWCLT